MGANSETTCSAIRSPHAQASAIRNPFAKAPPGSATAPRIGHSRGPDKLRATMAAPVSNAAPETAPPAPARNLSLDVVLCAILGLVTLYGIFGYARLPLSRPRPADYAAAADYLRAHNQSGDLIDLNPFWASRLRERIGDL